jgi:hypothetical protein
MVESNKPKNPTLEELEVLSELELEQLIQANYNKDPECADDCRYTLGKLMLEGTNQDSVPLNMIKGLNWVKEAQKHGHALADELKTYHDIKFERGPKEVV